MKRAINTFSAQHRRYAFLTVFLITVTAMASAEAWMPTPRQVLLGQQNGGPPDEPEESSRQGQTESKGATITAEAQAVLDQLRAAYDKLQAAQFDGQITAAVDLGGKNQKMQHKFTSSFQTPNKFRHELEDGLMIGSTGEKTYVYQKSAKAFFQQKAPDDKAAISDLPSPIPQLLQTQNPSLLFAIIRDPIRGVTDNMRQINKVADSRIRNKQCPTLVLIPDDEQSRITLVMDPETHLLQRLEIEIGPDTLKESKTQGGLKGVHAEIDYTSIQPQSSFKAGHFAWTAPDGVKEVGGMEKEKTSAKTLIGKQAPDFTLETIEGDSISLSDLKGQVIVLDFWATWCPPCVKSLPDLEQIYQEKASDGVKVFAINLKENEQSVKSFLRARNLLVPVLLDNEGTVAGKYNIEAIPQTVIIGKDGEVKKVFIGAGAKGADEIRAEIESLNGIAGE